MESFPQTKNDMAEGATIPNPPEGRNIFASLRAVSGYSRLIILLGIMLIAGLWMLVWHQVNYEYDRSIAEATTETMNLTKAFEEHVRRVAKEADKELMYIKLAYERDGISSPGIIVRLQEVAKDSSQSQVTVSNEQGLVVVSLLEPTLGTNIADRQHFQVHREVANVGLYIAKPIMGRTAGETLIPLTRRVNKPDGSFGGIVFIGVKVNYFLDFYKKVDLGENQLITLTGMDGFTRARRAGDQLDADQDVRGGEVWRRAQSHPEDSYIASSVIDNVNRIVSYRVMPDYPLIVSVSKSTKVALAGYEQRKRGYIIGASLVSFFFLFLCGLLVNRHENVLRKYERLTLAEEELTVQNIELQSKDLQLTEVNRKLVEAGADVQAEKDRLSALINSISDEVWFADTEENITWENQVAFESFRLGSTNVSIIELIKDMEILRPDGSPRPYEEGAMLRSLGGEVVRDELEFIRTPATGELRYREISSNPVRDAGGNIIGAVAIARDVTERKAMEKKLQEQNEQLIKQKEELAEVNRKLVKTGAVLQTEKDRLSSLVNSMSEEVWFADTEQKFTLANRVALRDFGDGSVGMTVDELASSLEVLNPDGSPRPVEEEPSALRALRGEVTKNLHEIVRIPASGELRFREVTANPVRDADGNIIGSVTVVRDITERKRMEEELARAREDYYKRCFDNMKDCFAIYRAKRNDQGEIVELICQAVNEAACANIGLTKEQQLGRGMLEVFPSHESTGLFNHYCQVVETGKPLELESPYHDAADAAISGTYDIRAIKIDDGIAIYWRNVTEKKKMEAEMARLDRLNLIGEMAASIGHEVRNPLTAVRGYLQFFQRKQETASYREQFQMMIDEIDQANGIISEFLSLAKNKAVELKPYNLNDVISALLPLLQAEALRTGHEILFDRGEVPAIDLDEKEIRQLLLNLARNGFEAMEAGGMLTIQTYAEEGSLVLAVRNTGPEIPPEVLKKLGTPFFSTKKTGTGLGLPVCYRIAEHHGAKIDVKTGLDGTTFSVKFNQRS